MAIIYFLGMIAVVCDSFILAVIVGALLLCLCLCHVLRL